MPALLRPGMVLAHLLVMAVAVSFVSLGLWQVRRSAEVATENERTLAQMAAAPLPLDRALRAEDVDLLPVMATGRYVIDAEVTLSPRSRNDVPGFEILTPLAVSGAEVVLVNRGWLPLDSPIPSPPAGEVEIGGRLRAPVTSRQVLTDDASRVSSLSSVDLLALDDQIDGLVTTAWIELVDDAALESGVLPRPAPPVVLDAGNHLSYAFQWFAFTLIGLVGYPLLLRRRLQDDRVGHAAPSR